MHIPTMVSAMNRLHRMLLPLLALASIVIGEEPAKPAMPPIADAIPLAVANLDSPTVVPFDGGITMAVSTSNENAQQHVLQGLNHLHGGWEFEASRHFAAAMQLDPDCLLAHWGMLMSLLDSSPETIIARRAVLMRLTSLMDQGIGTDLEKGYVNGILQYLEKGPQGAVAAFGEVADRFPNDMQAAIFAALFKRGGYDITGSATPDQLVAEKQLVELTKRFPDSALPLNALLMIRAEAPDSQESLKLARELSRMQPGYPPVYHVLGHYEWRNGNHKLAAAAFGRASMLYRNWMRHNKASVADCPQWVTAECYRVVALLSMGDDETAYAAARQIAATPIPKGRESSAGARALLWEAKTLPARILIHRGLNANAADVAMELPKPEEIQPYHEHSLAFHWIDGLRIALEAQRLTDAGDLTAARQVEAAMENHILYMAQSRQQAWSGSEGSQWSRAYQALRVLNSDIRGRIALASPPDMRSAAFNWYSSAIDHQRHASLLNPPLILTPMAARLGDYFVKIGQPEKAIDYYHRALETIPGDVQSLVGLRSAYIAAGNTEKAAEIGLEILNLKQD